MINDLHELSPRRQNAGNEKNLARLAAGLSRISREMEEKSVAVIFQSGNPFIREAQCTPDMANPQWYQFDDHTICSYYTQAETLTRRKPLDDVLRRIQKDHPNFFNLDLMPVLCAEDVCKMYNRHGVFLYRDEWSHMSAEANLLARNLFLSVVHQAIAGATSPTGMSSQIPK